MVVYVDRIICHQERNNSTTGSIIRHAVNSNSCHRSQSRTWSDRAIPMNTASCTRLALSIPIRPIWPATFSYNPRIFHLPSLHDSEHIASFHRECIPVVTKYRGVQVASYTHSSSTPKTLDKLMLNQEQTNKRPHLKQAYTRPVISTCYTATRHAQRRNFERQSSATRDRLIIISSHS